VKLWTPGSRRSFHRRARRALRLDRSRFVTQRISERSLGGERLSPSVHGDDHFLVRRRVFCIRRRGRPSPVHAGPSLPIGCSSRILHPHVEERRCVAAISCVGGENRDAYVAARIDVSPLVARIPAESGALRRGAAHAAGRTSRRTGAAAAHSAGGCRGGSGEAGCPGEGRGGRAPGNAMIRPAIRAREFFSARSPSHARLDVEVAGWPGRSVGIYGEGSALIERHRHAVTHQVGPAQWAGGKGPPPGRARQAERTPFMEEEPT
jgi:hypothetical protein